MSEGERHTDSGEHHAGVSAAVLNLLESLDNIAHVLVAVFFIILAGSVLVYTSLMLVRDMPLIVQTPRVAAAEHPVGPEHGPASTATTQSEPETSPNEHSSPPSAFLHGSLELLSTLLFAVIVLELLKTIITYLKTHNIQAIMKEFLVVGIISSIRKILLVGAESSLASDATAAYVKEATGTVITIAGILLLIAGLVFLQWSENVKWKAQGQ